MSEPTGKPTFRPSLASRLAILEAELSGSDSPIVEVEVGGPSVRLGLESGGVIWLTIDCDPNEVETDDRSPSVVIAATPQGGRVKIASTVERTVALHYLEEVVDLVQGGHPAGDAQRFALQRWREMLAQAPGSRLSDKALVGLFGELEVLETIVTRGGGLDHWTGWQQDHNDFRLPGLAIEVKSTMSADFRRVEIHGLRQLDDPEDGSDLVLVLRRLEKSPEGRCVPDLTDALVRLGVSRSELLERLSEVGYSEQHRNAYEASRFSSEELIVRRVTADHPRLTPDLLERVDLTAVDKIDYVLNLNASPHLDLDEDLVTLLDGVLRGPT